MVPRLLGVYWNGHLTNQGSKRGQWGPVSPVVKSCKSLGLLIAHKLVEVAVQQHHAPKKIKDLILDCYIEFSLRVSSGPVTSVWQTLEEEMITGCIILVTHFALVFMSGSTSVWAKTRSWLS